MTYLVRRHSDWMKGGRLQLFVFGVFFFLSVTLLFYFYSSFMGTVNDRLELDSSRIEKFLKGKLNGIFYECLHIGTHVASLKTDNSQSITKVIEDHANVISKSKHRLSWLTFGWITPALEQVYDTANHNYTKPIDVSHRPNVKNAAQNPWHLYISSTPINHSSGFREILGSIGITDDDGRLSGVLCFSINIFEFSQIITEAMPDLRSNFMLIDQNNRVVVQSDEDSVYRDITYDLDHSLVGLSLLSSRGFFAKPVAYRNIDYKHYSRLQDLPFTLLLGANRNQFFNAFLKVVLPRILELSLLGLVCLLFIHYIRKSILDRLKNSYQRRENFMRDIGKEIVTNVSDVQVCCEILKRSAANQVDLGLTPEKQIKLIERIAECTESLAYTISGDIKFSGVNLNEVVEDVVEIMKFDFYLRGLKVDVSLDQRMPIINASSLAVKQVVLELISLCFDFATNPSLIKISTFFSREEMAESAHIIIEDDGLVMDIEDIRRITGKYKTENVNFGTSIAHFNMKAIDHYVEAHRGNLSISSSDRGRRIITLALPYDTGEDNNIDLDLEAMISKSNVVKFERR
jgi:signal transduction histidine kinase